MYIVDRSTLRFVDANDAACALFGCDRATLLCMGPADVLPLTTQQIQNRYDALIAASGTDKLALPARPAPDARGLLTEQPKAALWADGRWQVICEAGAVGTRNGADRLDPGDDAPYRQVVEQLADCAVVMLDLGGQISSWNTGAGRMMGYAASEIVGGDLGRLYTPQAQADGSPVAHLKATAALGRFEVTGERQRKDGTCFWASATLTALHDAAGTLRGYFLVMLDLSEPLWNRNALRNAELKFARTLDASADLIAVIKRKSGEILEANIGFERIAGYDRSEAVGKSFAELGLWEKSAAHSGDLSEPPGSLETLGLERTLRRPDGSTRTLILWMENLDGGSEPCLLLIGRDITEWKRLQSENHSLQNKLRESQKMEALGTLAGGVAHDFNNALTIVAASVELARQELPPGHPALAHLVEIGRAGARSRRLVQQILAFAHKETLKRSVMALEPLVLDSAHLLRAVLPPEVSLQAHCSGKLPPILADATQIEQVLINLCTNALQAPPVPGRPRVIQVSARVHHQPAGAPEEDLKPGLYVCLEVRDNGPGVDAATLDRIFDPYFTTKSIGSGTGLGLSVVHGIVKAHDAHITVRSPPGAGTEFCIYFRASDLPVPTAAPARTSVPVQGIGHGERLLYVDDEVALTSLVKRLLERQGFQVTAFSDPQAAIAEVRENPQRYALVITDYNMPGASGLTVARMLREINPKLPVILVTGHVSPELLAEATTAGVLDVIYKPDTVNALASSIASRLRSPVPAPAEAAEPCGATDGTYSPPAASKLHH
jgi:PAS domain S-box-containing protein